MLWTQRVPVALRRPFWLTLLHHTMRYQTEKLADRWLFLPTRSETHEGDVDGPLRQATVTLYGDTALRARCLPTRQRLWAGEQSWVEQSFSYDGWGNPTSVTAYNSYATGDQPATANPQPTTTRYDDQGLLPLAVTNALQQTVTTVYDYRWQQPTSVTDANGQSTTTSYDRFGRVTTVTLPRLSSCAATDNAPDFIAVYGDTAFQTEGQPYYEQAQQRIDDCTATPIYATTVVHYDGLGRKLQAQSPGDTPDRAIVSDVVYDTGGRVVRSSVPRQLDRTPGAYSPPTWQSGFTATSYDSLDRPAQVTAPDGTTTQMAYTLVDNRRVTSQIDANGHQRQQQRDEWGQLRAVVEYRGNGGNQVYAPYATMRYRYDLLGNLTQVVDAQGNTTTIRYDGLSRKIAMTDPDMGEWRYSYDPLGNLTSQSDARGTVTTLTYDALNRVTAKRYSDATPGITFAYDRYPDSDEVHHTIGRLTRLDDGSGFTAYVYDERGRLAAEQRFFSGTYASLMAGQPNGYVTAYDYDRADRLRVLHYPSGEQLSHRYTTRGLLLTQASNESGYQLRDSRYNALGQLTDRTMGNDTVLRQSYYSAEAGNSRLQQLCVTTSPTLGATVPEPVEGLNFAYQYDAVGNLPHDLCLRWE